MYRGTRDLHPSDEVRIGSLEKRDIRREEEDSIQQIGVPVYLVDIRQPKVKMLRSEVRRGLVRLNLQFDG